MEAFTISTASIVVGELGDKTQLLTLILIVDPVFQTVV